MENKEIISRLKQLAKLLELHEANPFKVRGYNSAVFHLEKIDTRLAQLDLAELQKLEGVGKGIATAIDEINKTNESQQLNELLSKTPEGLIPLLDVKGAGPKKIRLIWQELGITDGEALLEACKRGEIAKLKGFGDKLQENLKQSLLFTHANVGKLHYSKAEELAEGLLAMLKEKLPQALISLSGELRRKLEVVSLIQVIIGDENPSKVFDQLKNFEALEYNEKISGPFSWRGKLKESATDIEIKLCQKTNFYNVLFKHTGSDKHLSVLVDEGKNLYQIISDHQLTNEKEAYDLVKLPFIEPEMREGTFEFSMAIENKLPELIKYDDLRGILHNHTTYSDGKHTLREMAECCRDMGYEYLGISDHSQIAVYANGLDEDRILQQHTEIDQLNKEMAPFKIFKGIESDILYEGQLDYPDDVLKTFDFIVASIHSQLNMDINQATNRLLTAIANPYTTMLGHPTGRLLLKREGYPIDHKTVIDACAEYGVIIEINANPWRLDLDWRWVHYALEKNVMLSINPDAHDKSAYGMMQYGIHVGRKGGLNKEMTFNALSLEKVEEHFNKRKELAAEKIK
ncbi:DNA polymerase/3'-5' exonuclease PolX [Fulvivirgaceae bacterium BMA10]|uniref:DNA polymerase/3'-5' exonuclease PolX n=1 Tax=Splendidivirga corallicola TaxID=3051826 RepID=A0ABT8KLA5_9BACT|nr:DNA polymerase/3'-5' exonuclease PolX [Fulvivirgaceae bacterium BMA10]